MRWLLSLLGIAHNPVKAEPSILAEFLAEHKAIAKERRRSRLAMQQWYRVHETRRFI